MTETDRRAQPSNAAMMEAFNYWYQQQQEQDYDANLITVSEDTFEIGGNDYETDEAWGAYPMTTRTRTRSPGPYDRTPKPTAKPAAAKKPVATRQTQPEVVIVNKPKTSPQPIEEDKEMELANRIEEIIKGTPVSESKKERKLKPKANLKYDIFEDIKGKQAAVTVEELMQVPTFREQMKKGIERTRQNVQFTEINSADIEDSDEDSEEDEDIKTSAQAVCYVENRMMNAIIDTGAGYCFMAKKAADLLDWKEYHPTKLTFVTADGKKVVPLGILKHVPIKFGNVTVSTRVLITRATNYNILISNQWLKKVRAKIDLEEEKLIINL